MLATCVYCAVLYVDVNDGHLRGSSWKRCHSLMWILHQQLLSTAAAKISTHAPFFVLDPSDSLLQQWTNSH